MTHRYVKWATLVLIIGLVFIFQSDPNVWMYCAAVWGLFMLVAFYGSFQIQANYFLHSINKGVNDGIAITFDDGPDPKTTPLILDILKEHGVKATFFVIGKKVDAHPDIVKRIFDEGHIIGNHSFSHANRLPFSASSTIESDILKCTESIEAVIDKRINLFRPPFGVTNPKYARVLKNLNLQSIGWSLRSFDTKAKSSKHLFQRIKNKLENRDIILLHDTQELLLEALPLLLDHCSKNGIEIEPLNQLIEKEAYNEE